MEKIILKKKIIEKKYKKIIDWKKIYISKSKDATSLRLYVAIHCQEGAGSAECGGRGAAAGDLLPPLLRGRRHDLRLHAPHTAGDQ